MRAQDLSVLVVADLCVLPYKVLFCLREAGVRNVFVLTNRRGIGLRYSRFRKRVFVTEADFNGSDPEAAIHVINDHVKKLGIDVIVPGDQNSTRLLIGIQPQLAAKCFPLPDAAGYQALYNKWEFFKLCRKQGVLHPETQLIADKDALLEKIRTRALSYPSICKPLELEAGNGVLKLTEANAREQAGRIYYQPVLLQEFIEGEDIGASVYCDKGEIRNFIAHRLRQQRYCTLPGEKIREAISRLVADVKLSGVCNFDMRLSPNGDVYFIDCNPRFFEKMMMSALAGINFVAAGLGLPTQAQVKDGTEVKLPRLFALTLLTKPHALSVTDVAKLCKLAADPVPFVRDFFRKGWSDNEAPINYHRELP